MKKSANALKLIACLFLSICSACTPRYDVKYDFDPPIANKTEFAKNKLGICLFEDVRPVIKSDYALFQDTWTVSDDLFEQKVPTMINNLVVNHFNHAFGNTGSVGKIEQDCNNGKIKELIGALQSKKNIDYILVGTMTKYTSRMYDQNANARNFFGYIPGMVLLFDADMENKTDIEFDNLLLIKIDGPQIVWKGSYKNNSVEPVKVFADRYERLARIHAENTKKAIQSILDNLLLSADKDFPQKLSVDESKKIVNKIKINRSLSDSHY